MDKGVAELAEVVLNIFSCFISSKWCKELSLTET